MHFEGPENVDPDFARALDEALGGESGVLLDGERQNLQGGWAGGRAAHYTRRPPPPSGFNEDGTYNLNYVSHTHEAIMTYMIANPTASQREIADHFGYSQTWLSVLIHSDLFQVRLREKQNLVLGSVAEDLTSKMKALADVGLEKIAAQVEKSEDPRFLLESTKMALTHLGFGAKAAGPQVAIQNNVQQTFVASRSDLEAARAMIAGAGAQVSLPAGDPRGVLATPTPVAPPLGAVAEEQRIVDVEEVPPKAVAARADSSASDPSVP